MVTDGTAEQAAPIQSAESTQAQPSGDSAQDTAGVSGRQSVESIGSPEMMADESVPMNLDDDRASRSSSAMDESMGSDSDVEQLGESGEEPMDLVDGSAASSPPATGSMESPPSRAPGIVDVTQVNQLEEEKSASREPSISSDAYEPPEPDEPVESEKAYSPPVSVEPMAMEPRTRTTAEITDGPHPNEPDQGPDVVPTEVGMPRSPTPVMTNHTDYALRQDENNVKSSRHFVPYQSPLSYFRAYRYHPHYLDNIKGGFRSLTYSNNINPNSPLCAFEIYGGVCNDRDCQFQHLRDLSLSGAFDIVCLGFLTSVWTFLSHQLPLRAQFRVTRLAPFITCLTSPIQSFPLVIYPFPPCGY